MSNAKILNEKNELIDMLKMSLDNLSDALDFANNSNFGVFGQDHNLDTAFNCLNLAENHTRRALNLIQRSKV